MDLEEVWRLREEEIYPGLFGPLSRGIFPLDQGVFQRFGEVRVDPRWLSHGVLEYGPHGDRESWVYVTSGYSNPWETEPEDYDPKGKSGSGVEFVLETEEQGNWAIVILRNMLAFDMMLTTGQVGAGDPLGFHDRIPIRAPIDGREGTMLRSLVTIPPSAFAEGFDLPSGRVNLMEFVGITDDEAEFAKEHGGGPLLQKLDAAGAIPVTRLARESVL